MVRKRRRLKGDKNRSRLKGRKDKTFWLIPVTRHLDDVLEDAVRRDAHITKSEFVREATRRYLESLGFSLAVPSCKEEAATDVQK
jgi:hypothetical protein